MVLEQRKKKSIRQMYLTIISSLFGDLGSSIFTYGLSFMILDKTGSVYSFALSSMVSPIIGLVLLPFVGTIIDKFSHKIIIAISQSCSIIGLIFFWLIFKAGRTNSFILALLLIIILRTSDQFTSTARQASNIQLVLPNELKSLTANTQIITSASNIISAIFGAFLYSLFPFELFIFLEIFAEFVTVLITLQLDFKLVFEKKQEVNENTSNFGLFKEGLHYLNSQKYILIVLILCLMVNFFSGIFSIGLPNLLLHIFKMNKVTYGILDAMNGLGFVLGGFLIQKVIHVSFPVHHIWKTSIQIGVTVCFIGLLSITRINIHYIIIFLGGLLLITGILFASANIPYQLWLQMSLPVEMQGRVFGVLNVMGLVVTPIGVFLYGIFFGVIKSYNLYFSAAIFFGTGILLCLLSFLLVHTFKLDLKKATIFDLNLQNSTGTVAKR